MENIRTQTIGIFPLPIVILPKENVRLHIYQKEFKALINDCFTGGNDFIIPFILNGEQTSIGIYVKLMDVERFYPDGKMDIKVEGGHLVRISSTNKPEKKLYRTCNVETIESSFPQSQLNELHQVFAKYCTLKGIEFQPNRQYDIYEIVKYLNLDKHTRIKLLRYSTNPIVQSIIVLNELRMLVLVQQLQNQAGYRFYMN